MSRRTNWAAFLLAAFLLSQCVTATPITAADDLAAGSLASFELQDYRGRTYKLGEFNDKPFLVIAFLGTECPLAKLYGPRLEQLANEYRDRQVQVIGIMSNQHDSITEIAAYARRHELEFPILKDLNNTLADQLGAQRTPEVYLLDAQRNVRYSGRIDDQYGIGYVRNEPQSKDLARALDELIAGKEVSVPATESVGCRIGRVREPDNSSEITYSNQVVRILHKNCISCHREGDIAPFAMTEYSEVAGWAETIAEVVEENRMPPWHAEPQYGPFHNANRLSDDEKQTILDWVAAGAPEGDPSLVPPMPTFTEGWQLPREPDQVIEMPVKYQVPATGEVKYQYFAVDPGFEEDKWIQAAELLPGNRAVVHHILVFIGRGDQGLIDEGEIGGFLVGYVPGKRIYPFPDGMAKRIPAGAKLVFQVHYTPIGSPQEDCSRLGLIFADPEQISHEVRTTSASETSFRIPPHDGNYRVEATSKKPLDDCQIIGYMPHMHLRGKSFLYEALYPSGEKEILLDIPRYDFNWQASYLLYEPKTIPAGTRIHCVAHFDNSENNLNNPDPTKTVRWGDQTWEEMMIGYFDIAVARDKDAN